MTEFDRDSLERLLPATTGAPDWDDVLTRSGALQRHRRRRLLMLAAAALVVAVGTASAFGVPAGIRAVLLDEEFAELPLEGARPSKPETGQLVLGYVGRPELSGSGRGFNPVSQVWIYADGRVIRRREPDHIGADRVGTGFFQRRLTPDGLKLLRSEVMSTGLFERDRMLLSVHGLAWGNIRARSGDGLVSVDWCCAPMYPPEWYEGRGTAPSREQAEVLSRLTELLAEPASFLPGSAWRDRGVSTFVPSKYAICFWGGPWTYSQPLEPSRIMRFLPTAAQDLLRGKARTYEAFAPLSTVACSEVRTEKARALGEILYMGGFQRDRGPGQSLTLAFQVPNSIRAVRAISFEPILPHGQWEAMGG